MPSKTTILEVLCRPNPQIDASYTKSGTNSTSPHWPDIDNWSRWEDFNARNLYDMYRPVVDADWAFDALNVSEPSRWDRRVFDEDSLDHYLNRFMVPHVNAALSHARHVLDMTRDYDLNLGRGGRCSHEGTTDRRFKPDWSLCSDSWKLDTGLFQNLLPGDSKLSSKWQSNMCKTDSHYSWKGPVSQISYYISELQVRYGWLVTDTELVVFRGSVELTGSGQAINRPTRQPPPTTGHHRATSVGTVISQLSSAMQNASISDHSYRPPDGGIEAFRVEYQTISWENHGNGRSRLSIRLALFYLAMMAGWGARSLLSVYPALDSWWWCEDDDSAFMHNTTGMRSKKRPKILEYHDPDGQRGPEWVTFTSEYGKSEDFLTRASARTLDVDHHRQQHYFELRRLDEHGNQVSYKVFVDESMLVFDEVTGKYGRYKDLVWAVEAAQQEGSQRDKKREDKGAGPSRSSKRLKK